MSYELRDYQVDAINRLENGSILQGETGCGKSLTAIAYYFEKICGGDQKKLTVKRKIDLYIITTAKKRDSLDWDKEAAKAGLSPSRDNSFYGMIYTVDSWNRIKEYIKVQGAFFIFDEQRLCGRGPWVDAFFKIAANNGWILLSATPGDTWSDYYPVFRANGFYRNLTDFEKQHCVFNRYTKYKSIEAYVGVKKLIAERDEITVVINYHHELERNHADIHVEYDRELYRATLRNRWDPFKQEPYMDASSMCYGLRRIVNDDQSRAIAVANIFTKHDKIIVFYNFDYELERLRALSEELEIPVAEWNGHNHQEVPTGDRWMYLVQYTAGAEAWNCITTNTIVFYSQNYSYKTMVQSAGRIDRLNTPFKTLFYYHLISDAPIDKAIARCLANKETFNDRTFMAAVKFSARINEVKTADLQRR
jgi:hypothetical protein